VTSEPHARAVVQDIAPLMRLLRESEPGRPRLTWYGADGERVELSGRVLDNWAVKTANLLVDELDVGPGCTVVLHLPQHWRTATWLLAVWSVGARAVVLADTDDPLERQDALDPDDVAVVVSDRPHLVGGLVAAGAQLVVQPLPALSRGWDGELPAGALDATTQVRGQGDVFVALSGSSSGSPHGPLFAAAAVAVSNAAWPLRPRVLVADAGLGPVHWLLAPLVADGSVVVVAAAPGSAGYRSAADQESITAGW
jgi:uncharacterized protein (TIGR03089 family)